MWHFEEKKAKPIASIYRKKDFLTPTDILYMTIGKLLGREHLIIMGNANKYL